MVQAAFTSMEEIALTSSPNWEYCIQCNGFPRIRESIHKKPPVPVDDATQARMQHGIQHEVSDFCMCI